MLQSPEIKNNPDLYVFLPLFYTVWSDAVLTPSEIATAEGLLRSQQWLSQEERNFLLAQLDPGSPPSAEEMMNWKEEIKRAIAENNGQESLVDIGIKL
ncbi:MAG TPA: acyl-CoA oxidase, partial [Cyclobacteriaceae bacterium]|nr:acyl-CoA oxidase [Cyclobacteriaceae bacterium]